MILDKTLHVLEEQLSPAQRRRRTARAALQETSELAELLMRENDAPLKSTKAIECQDCWFPRNNDEFNWARGVHHAILLSQRDRLKSLMVIFPSKLNCLLLSEKTAEKREIRKKQKDKNFFLLRQADELTKSTPLPIHLAAAIGEPDIFEILLYLSTHSSLTLANSRGETVLHLAVKRGNLSIVLKAVNAFPIACSHLDDEGNLPIHVAVGEVSRRNGEIPLITSALLANYPRSMLIRDRSGFAPIHIAAMNGFEAGIRGLLAVNPGCVNDRTLVEGFLPIDLALRGHRQILETLHKIKGHGTSLNDTVVPPDSVEADTSLNILVGQSINILDNDPLLLSGSKLLDMKASYEESIEMLLMSVLYCRAVFCPREEGFEDDINSLFFLPLHAAFVARILPESWDHLKSMYGALHIHDVDRYGRTVLHALSDACLLEDSSYTEAQLVDMVRDVDKMDPNASMRLDGIGLLPLHGAILNGASANVVKAFIEIRPKALKSRFIG